MTLDFQLTVSLYDAAFCSLNWVEDVEAVNVDVEKSAEEIMW